MPKDTPKNIISKSLSAAEHNCLNPQGLTTGNEWIDSTFLLLRSRQHMPAKYILYHPIGPNTVCLGDFHSLDRPRSALLIAELECLVDDKLNGQCVSRVQMVSP